MEEAGHGCGYVEWKASRSLTSQVAATTEAGGVIAEWARALGREVGATCLDM